MTPVLRSAVVAVGALALGACGGSRPPNTTAEAAPVIATPAAPTVPESLAEPPPSEAPAPSEAAPREGSVVGGVVDEPRGLAIGGIPEPAVRARLAEPFSPPYPAEARAAGLEGRVALRVTVAADGSVLGVERLRGEPLLARDAIERLRQSRFTPGQDASGAAVTSTVVIVFRFVLGDSPPLPDGGAP